MYLAGTREAGSQPGFFLPLTTRPACTFSTQNLFPNRRWKELLKKQIRPGESPVFKPQLASITLGITRTRAGPSYPLCLPGTPSGARPGPPGPHLGPTVGPHLDFTHLGPLFLYRLYDPLTPTVTPWCPAYSQRGTFATKDVGPELAPDAGCSGGSLLVTEASDLLSAPSWCLKWPLQQAPPHHLVVSGCF